MFTPVWQQLWGFWKRFEPRMMRRSVYKSKSTFYVTPPILFKCITVERTFHILCDFSFRCFAAPTHLNQMNVLKKYLKLKSQRMLNSHRSKNAAPKLDLDAFRVPWDSSFRHAKQRPPNTGVGEHYFMSTLLYWHEQGSAKIWTSSNGH